MESKVNGQSKVRGRPASNARVVLELDGSKDRVGGEQESEVSIEGERAAMI